MTAFGASPSLPDALANVLSRTDSGPDQFEPRPTTLQPLTIYHARKEAAIRLLWSRWERLHGSDLTVKMYRTFRLEGRFLCIRKYKSNIKPGS
jgi:hypothetical protein